VPQRCASLNLCNDFSELRDIQQCPLTPKAPLARDSLGARRWLGHTQGTRAAALSMTARVPHDGVKAHGSEKQGEAPILQRSTGPHPQRAQGNSTLKQSAR